MCDNNYYLLSKDSSYSALYILFSICYDTSVILFMSTRVCSKQSAISRSFIIQELICNDNVWILALFSCEVIQLFKAIPFNSK